MSTKTREAEKALIERTYRKIQAKYPEATLEQQEMLVRKSLLKRKLLTGLAMWLGGFGMGLGADELVLYLESIEPQTKLLLFLIVYLRLLEFAAIGVWIAGPVKMIKALHDPLTPAEETELRARDAIEKGGGPA